MLDQYGKRFTNGIGQIAMFQINFFVRCMKMIIAHNNLSRHADYDRIGRCRFDDHSIRSNAAVVSYSDRPQHLGTCTNDNVIANRWMTLGLLQACPAQRDAMIKSYTITNFGGFANDHTHAVIDEEIMPNRRAGMDFDAGDSPHDLRDRPRN